MTHKTRTDTLCRSIGSDDVTQKVSKKRPTNNFELPKCEEISSGLVMQLLFIQASWEAAPCRRSSISLSDIPPLSITFAKGFSVNNHNQMFILVFVKVLCSSPSPVFCRYFPGSMIACTFSPKASWERFWSRGSLSVID